MKFWRKINMNMEEAGKVARRAALAGMSAVFLASATGCGGANVEKENQQKIQAEDTIKKSQEVRESIKEEKAKEAVRPITAAKLEEQRKAAEDVVSITDDVVGDSISDLSRVAKELAEEPQSQREQLEQARRDDEARKKKEAEEAEEAKRVAEEQARKIAEEQAKIAQEQQANIQETQGNRGRAREQSEGRPINGAEDAVF